MHLHKVFIHHTYCPLLPSTSNISDLSLICSIYRFFFILVPRRDIASRSEEKGMEFQTREFFFFFFFVSLPSPSHRRSFYRIFQRERNLFQVLLQLVLVLHGSLIVLVAGKSSKSSASLSLRDNRASVEPLRDRTSRDTTGYLEIDGNRANALHRFALFAWR